MFALLGLAMSPLFTEPVLLFTVRPDLESITLPELSTIRVLDPEVLSPLFTDELLVVPEFLLYAEVLLALSPDLLLTLPLVEPLVVRPEALAMLDLPLADPL